MGNIEFSSTPDGAAIWIDDDDTGEVTPITISDISEGNYTIKLILADYRDWTGLAIVPFEGSVSIEASLIPLSQPVGLANTPWPRFHHDNRSSGQSPYASYTDGTPKWSLELGDCRSGSVIGPNGTIYLYVDHIGLYAINPSNGSEKWSSPLFLGGSYYGGPALSIDGTIYMGTSLGLYAITDDGDHGTIKWLYDMGYEYVGYSSAAIGSDGTIYIITGDATLYAINPDGTLKWFYTRPGTRAKSSPAIGLDGTIYMLCEYNFNCILVAVNPNGTWKWEYNIGGWQSDANSPSIGIDGNIYAGGGNGDVYMFGPNGNDTFIINVGGTVHNSPAFSPDNTTVYIGADNDLCAIDIANKEIIWRFPTGDWIRSSPAVAANGIIYFGSDDNYVYALNSNGELIWSFLSSDGVRGSPAIDSDGTVYIGDRGLNFHAFESILPTGVPICTTDLKYSGEDVTLQATPKDGIGPYYVKFLKDEESIDPSRLAGDGPPDSIGVNPISNVTEGDDVIRVYTLDDEDIRTALTGTIDFSVYMEDSCPTGAQTCAETCTINIGCVAPVCNFVVT